jgi:hypothetical protein
MKKIALLCCITGLSACNGFQRAHYASLPKVQVNGIIAEKKAQGSSLVKTVAPDPVCREKGSREIAVDPVNVKIPCAVRRMPAGKDSRTATVKKVAKQIVSKNAKELHPGKQGHLLPALLVILRVIIAVCCIIAGIALLSLGFGGVVVWMVLFGFLLICVGLPPLLALMRPLFEKPNPDKTESRR